MLDIQLGRAAAERAIAVLRGRPGGRPGEPFWWQRSMARIHQIRQKIIARTYYLSGHAEEEMLDDGLEREDVENAILKGRIEKRLSEDIRGTRYRIEGPDRYERLIHTICRFKEDGNLIIITVYALTEAP